MSPKVTYHIKKICFHPKFNAGGATRTVYLEETNSFWPHRGEWIRTQPEWIQVDQLEVIPTAQERNDSNSDRSGNGEMKRTN